jgi:hypothetical protein
LVAGKGVGEPGEEGGVVGGAALGFFEVVLVVEADTEDFGGVGDERQVSELAGAVVGSKGVGKGGDATEGLGGEEGAEVREGGADVAAEVENAVVTGDAVGGTAFCNEAYVGHAIPCSLGCWPGNGFLDWMVEVARRTLDVAWGGGGLLCFEL